MEFRRKALENLRAPDDLDSPVRLARPRAWAVLAVLAMLITAGTVWAVAGTLDRKVAAPGLLTHPLGVSRVQSPQGGLVSDIFVSSANMVPKGTPVLSVVTPRARPRSSGRRSAAG
jgi:multidrug efflux pump subunit AcrA (membrane-fusion protein)